MVQPSGVPLGGKVICRVNIGEEKEGLSLRSIHTSGRWMISGGVAESRKLPGAM